MWLIKQNAFLSTVTGNGQFRNVLAFLSNFAAVYQTTIEQAERSVQNYSELIEAFGRYR